jgi:hypothetical protein
LNSPDADLILLYRQHLQKLKKKEGPAIQTGVGSGGEGSSTPAPKTPARKRAPAKKTGTATKSAGKRKVKDEEQSEDDMATPSKKAKTEEPDTK